MKIFTAKTKNLAVIMGLTLALGGCISGGTPFAYTELHEIPAGPGLLSGEEGGYSLELGSNKISQTVNAKSNSAQHPSWQAMDAWWKQ